MKATGLLFREAMCKLAIEPTVERSRQGVLDSIAIVLAKWTAIYANVRSDLRKPGCFKYSL